MPPSKASQVLTAQANAEALYDQAALPKIGPTLRKLLHDSASLWEAESLRLAETPMLMVVYEDEARHTQTWAGTVDDWPEHYTEYNGVEWSVLQWDIVLGKLLASGGDVPPADLAERWRTPR